MLGRIKKPDGPPVQDNIPTTVMILKENGPNGSVVSLSRVNTFYHSIHIFIMIKLCCSNHKIIITLFFRSPNVWVFYDILARS